MGFLRIHNECIENAKNAYKSNKAKGIDLEPGECECECMFSVCSKFRVHQ